MVMSKVEQDFRYARKVLVDCKQCGGFPKFVVDKLHEKCTVICVDCGQGTGRHGSELGAINEWNDEQKFLAGEK